MVLVPERKSILKAEIFSRNEILVIIGAALTIALFALDFISFERIGI